jgi:hypothetical protein
MKTLTTTVKHNYVMIFLALCILCLLGFLYYERQKEVEPIDTIILTSLKAKLDSIKLSDEKLNKTMTKIDFKIDSVSTKINKTKSSINNIYKTELHEKEFLNVSSDSINRQFFDDYIHNWITSGTNKSTEQTNK